MTEPRSAGFRDGIRANPGLGPLLAAQVPADFADWLDFVAIGALLAFVWTVPTLAFAWLAVALGLPYLTVGLLAGALVDRLPLRSVLILSNLGRAAATAAMILAPDWQTLVAIVFLRGCADAFYTPAKQAAMQAIVRPQDLPTANGMSHAINQSSKIIAPALGGIILTIAAPQMLFAGNAVVSLLAAAMQVRLPPLARPVTTPAPVQSLWRDIRAGLALIRTLPTLRATILLMAAGYFAIFFYDTLIAPLIRAFGHSETALGIALAAVGTGGLLGALGLHNLTLGTRRSFTLIAGSAAAGALMIGGMGVAEAAGRPLPVWAIAGLFGLTGISSSLNLIPTRVLLQTHTPRGSMGMVTALSEAINTVALMTAPFIGATLAQATSVGAAFVMGGAMMLVVAAAAAWFAQSLAGNTD